jgi:glycosyl transferase family 25
MNKSIYSLVINLARDYDRFKWFLENAKYANLEVERLEAIDAKNLEMRSLIEKHRAPASQLSDSEIACILSHREAWKKLLNSTHSYMAVFEDDVLLSAEAGKLLSLDLLPNNMDLIKLETLNRKVPISQRSIKFLGDRKLVRLLTKHYCAAGYIVSKDAAKRLLELTEVNSNALDYVLFDERSTFWKEFHVYQLTPALCMQDKIYAEIQNSEHQFTSNIETTQTRFNYGKRRFQRIKRSFEKFFRYLSCVARGANPFKFRVKIPFVK